MITTRYLGAAGVVGRIDLAGVLVEPGQPLAKSAIADNLISYVNLVAGGIYAVWNRTLCEHRLHPSIIVRG